jgi:hypothetical protein
MINILHCPLLSVWAYRDALIFSRAPFSAGAHDAFAAAPVADPIDWTRTAGWGARYAVNLLVGSHHVNLPRDGFVHQYRITLPNDRWVLLNILAVGEEIFASAVVTLFLDDPMAAGVNFLRITRAQDWGC